MNELKVRAKRWLPPALVEAWGRRSHRWAGLEIPLQSGPGLQNSGHGYSNPLIIDFVERAAREALVNGSGYERDGLFFNDRDLHWPILGPLLAVRIATPATLRVVDIGGSLGSKWIQHRRWLDLLSPLKWAVVEQSHYVTRAKTMPFPETLTFHDSLELAAQELGGVDVAIFSSSLQYLESPMTTLGTAMELAERAVMVDRTTFSDSQVDTRGRQHVTLYGTSVTYPCWILNWHQATDVVERRFAQVGTWREPLPYGVHPHDADTFLGGIFGLERRG